MAVVLIAFERESEQSTIEQLLSERGHRVLKSANGLVALDMARREPPDVIVSDIVLPRMDGFALCRKWKQDERLQSIPFVFYTQRHDDPKYERFARELGAERFLARSAQPEALAAALDELLADKPAAAAPVDAALKRAQALQEVRAQTRELERVQQAQSGLRMRIGELEATNQRLAAGEARFRRVFEGNPLPMWIVDRATSGFIAANDRTLALYGYDRSEFLALKVEALSAPEQGMGDGVHVHRRKDGSAFCVALAARDIEFDGRAADLVAAYDLSSRVAAERQLQEQLQQKQQQLEQKSAERHAWFETMADGCWMLDAESRLLDVNAAYCRLVGHSRDELLGKQAWDLEDTGSGDDTMRLQLGRLRGGERYETKHRCKDGSLVDVEVSIGQLDARADRVVVIRDVSQYRRERIAQRTAQRQLEHLVDLFKQSETLDEPALVRRAIEEAQEATNSPLAYLFLVDAKANSVALVAMREGHAGQVVMTNADPQPVAHAGTLADCIRGKHAVSGNDPSRQTQLPDLPDLQHWMAVPMMMAADDVIGVLGVANRQTAYGDGDRRALAFLADSVARLMHGKRKLASTMQSLQRTDVAMQGMIDSFVRMSERHDPYTAGSARRLASLAVAIGREAGLDGERQHALRVAALLHDVGNIAVPASILAKPAPLTETELALMRTHVEEGCQLLADIDLGGPVADIVYQSHERYDGSGYPRGLKGEEILTEARILAIADTVEAMCSARSYRPAASVAEALDEINRAAGRLYDRQLVEACTRLIKERNFVLPD